MAKSVNKVILLGNVGKEPEFKMLPSGQGVANFSVATSERYKDKGGEWQERTEWHNLVAYAKLAEIVRDYVKKGSKLYVEGRITTRSWDDKESGKKVYRTEIVIGDLSLLSGRGEGEAAAATPAPAAHRPAPLHSTSAAPTTTPTPPKSPTTIFRSKKIAEMPGHLQQASQQPAHSALDLDQQHPRIEKRGNERENGPGNQPIQATARSNHDRNPSCHEGERRALRQHKMKEPLPLADIGVVMRRPSLRQRGREPNENPRDRQLKTKGRLRLGRHHAEC